MLKNKNMFCKFLECKFLECKFPKHIFILLILQTVLLKEYSDKVIRNIFLFFHIIFENIFYFLNILESISNRGKKR